MASAAAAAIARATLRRMRALFGQLFFFFFFFFFFLAVRALAHFRAVTHEVLRACRMAGILAPLPNAQILFSN